MPNAPLLTESRRLCTLHATHVRSWGAPCPHRRAIPPSDAHGRELNPLGRHLSIALKDTIAIRYDGAVCRLRLRHGSLIQGAGRVRALCYSLLGACSRRASDG